MLLVLRPLPLSHRCVPIDPTLVQEEVLVHLQDGCRVGDRGWVLSSASPQAEGVSTEDAGLCWGHGTGLSCTREED